jgi:hypothetical protein
MWYIHYDYILACCIALVCCALWSGYGIGTSDYSDHGHNLSGISYISHTQPHLGGPALRPKGLYHSIKADDSTTEERESLTFRHTLDFLASTNDVPDPACKKRKLDAVA